MGWNPLGRVIATILSLRGGSCAWYAIGLMRTMAASMGRRAAVQHQNHQWFQGFLGRRHVHSTV